MPARRAAYWQAWRGVLVSMGRSPLCQRLPGNSQPLDFLRERREGVDPEGTQTGRHRTVRQHALDEEISMALQIVLRTQAIGRALERSRESFARANVRACGSLRVITSLGCLQHDSAYMGHRDL